MRHFYDTQLQKWTINLTWDIAEDIFKRVERPDSTKKHPKHFDLFNLTDQDQADCFVTHDHTGRFSIKKGKCLVNMLYVICEEQCKERNISDLDFAKVVSGVPFGHAMEALMEEIGNFIPDPVRRTMFQNLLSLADGGQLAVLSEAAQLLTEKVTALHATTTQMLKDQIEPEWEKAMKQMEDAVAASGTTNSSNTVEDSESIQEN